MSASTNKSRSTAQARDSQGRFVSKSSGQATDAYRNLPARQGYGTTSLVNGAEFPLTRFSNDYITLLSLYRENWLCQRIVDVPAMDMLKAWPTITSDISPDDLKHLDRTLARTKTKEQLLTTLKWARLFGGAGGFLIIDGQEEMLDEPLDLDTIELGSFRGVIPFDRWSGITPSTSICSDINKPLQFGLPESYQVHPPTGGKTFEVHASRIIRFTGPMVPSPEFQAQSYWGISVIEPVWDCLKMVESAQWNVVNLLFRAQIFSEKNPELASLLSGAASTQASLQKFQERMAMKNALLSNQGMNITGKDGGLESFQYSFGGIADVLQQLQLFVSGAAQIPVSILYGRTISGLGQSNDADLQIYEDRVSQWQNSDLRPVFEHQIYPVICMSEFGEVPDDLDIDFPSIRSMTEKDKWELAKTGTEAVMAPYDIAYGRKSLLTGLKQLGDPIGLFQFISQDMIDAADDVVSIGDVPETESLINEEEPEQVETAA